MATMCPKCGSDRASESYEGRTAGSLLEVWLAYSPGAAIGSIVTVMGRFAVGASTGAFAGVSPDGSLFEGYECHSYEYSFG